VTLAKRNLSRWEAEIINSHRHSELKKLNTLNQELNEFTELFENAKKVKIAALDALNKIQSSMQSLPSEITKAKNLIAEKKQTQALVEKKQVSIIQLIEEKKVFISGFDSITETSKNFAVKQKSDSILQQANSKLIESMSLFKQDFADTQNQLASVQEELLIAKQAVNDAEKNYQGKIKIQNSMPSLIEQKMQVLSEATNKFATAEKEFNSIVSKIDKQTKVTLDLLNKYTRLLPEKN
jgi:chromosome segregation ATPase